MIEPIYVVEIDFKDEDQQRSNIKKDIKVANDFADDLARQYSGREIHICRTIRVIKAAKPELAPIQELSVGPGRSTEQPTTEQPEPAERRPEKCVHLKGLRCNHRLLPHVACIDKRFKDCDEYFEKE